jgi:hypothetical protein
MNKKPKKELGEATRASVKKEMAKPRMSMSVRKSQVNPAVARITPGTLTKNKLPQYFPKQIT